MNRTKPSLIAMTVVTLVAALGFVACSKVRSIAVDDSGEPVVTYIVQFRQAAFLKDTPQNRQAFADALSIPNHKAVFRHNMGIYDKDGNCDQQGLEDAGVTNPKPCTSGPLMGQQVTQRVGFNNAQNLQDALKYVK
jgi:hypothetical protein